MEEAKLQALAQIKAFLDGTTEVAFRVPKAERNTFIERVLKRIGYACHDRSGRGVLLRYIERMTGLSRQQFTRLVRQPVGRTRLLRQYAVFLIFFHAAHCKRVRPTRAGADNKI